MNTYTIYLNAQPIACVSFVNHAYTCFEAATSIAEMTGGKAMLVWDETGEIIADNDFSEEPFEPTCECEARNCGHYWQDEDDICPRCHFEGAVAPCEEEDDYYEDDDGLECGFDPYMGCYTDDC